jgi:hypothetical protein
MTKTYCASLLLALFTTTWLAGAGCSSWVQANKGQLITAAECAGADMLKQVDQLVAAVKAGNMSVIAAAGSDVLQCALPLLASSLGPAAPASLTVAPSLAHAQAAAAAAVRAELERRGIKVKP